MSYKSLLRKTFRRFGLSITRLPRAGGEVEQGFHYAEVNPHATLSPWLDDADFMAAYEVVREYTLVDIYRLYELWSLVAETRHLPGDIVEVGVWRGGSGALMAHREALTGGSATVWLADTFQGVVKAGERDTYYRGAEHKDAGVPHVRELEKHFSLSNTRILAGIFPDDTGAQLTSDAIRLCHIDVDAYQSAKDTFTYVWDRMPVGGMAVFDDYGFARCSGVVHCVNELRAQYPVTFIHNLNGHAILIKRAA